MGGIPWPSDCLVDGVATLNCLPTVVLNAVNALLLFAGSTALFIMVWSGIRFITSGGDAKQIQSARSMFTYAIIGLIIVLSSFGMVFFIAYLTNTTDCITNIDKITTGCN